MKYYYPLEYMKNALTNAYLRKEEIEDTIQECRRLGIKFLPVDINSSKYEFTLENENIRIGFCAIKSFGEGAAEEAIAKRPFISLEDFLDRVEKSKCSKRSIVPAIFTGAFSCFDEDRRAVFEDFCALRDDEVPEEIKVQGGQAFNLDDPYDVIEEILLGASIISDPVNSFERIGFADFKKGESFIIKGIIRRTKKIKTKAGETMAFITLETADGYIDCTVFPQVYKKHKGFYNKGLMIYVTAKKENEDSCIVSSLR